MTRILSVALGLLVLTTWSRAADPIAPEQFTRLVALIKPQKGEERFREVPWRTSLWQARLDAAKEGKPIVAFLMSGAPLGCT